MKSMKTKNLILCALFVALIAVGAFIRIPIPVVPFTLQTLFTMMAGLLLGGKLGAVAVAVYIALGLFGLPVFAEGGGLAYILKPSFGYIIGFAVGAYATGVIANKVPSPGYKRLLAANYLNDPIGLWPLFLYCFILVVPGDIVLCILGAILGKRLIPIMKKNGV